MRSMTGFGRGEAVSANGKVIFKTEISSVNRKQFELKTFLPKEMLAADIEIRRLVAAKNPATKNPAAKNPAAKNPAAKNPATWTSLVALARNPSRYRRSGISRMTKNGR